MNLFQAEGMPRHDRSHVGLRTPSQFFCHYCGSKKHLKRCSRCHNAFYCCKEHQRSHWRIHKDNCMENAKKMESVYVPGSSVRLANFQFAPATNEHLDLANLINNSELPLDLNDGDFGSFDINPADTDLLDEEVLSCLFNGDVDFSNKSLVTDELPNNISPCDNEISGVAYARNKTLLNSDQAVGTTRTDNQYPSPSTFRTECNLLNDLNFDELNASINEYLDLASYHYGVNKSDNGTAVTEPHCSNPVTTKPEIRKTDKSEHRSLIENWENSSLGRTGRKPIVHEVFNLCESRKDNWFVEMKAEPATKLSTAWLEQVCTNIVEDMNNFGICVIDNFLGLKSGEMILDEVKALYGDGQFREGQLVSSKKQCSPQIIRGDSITWVDGTEENCQNISHLIHTLDAIVMKCTNMKNNGLLKKHHINRRSKAMIACYPGNGTRYVKHVDNPNQDGRCITSIYYLNKNWDIKLHGGLLRMFPVGHNNHVANIEPLFDRILFFWSDRRNPHEVQPAFAVRFAITVWYCDSNERSQAIKHYNESLPN